MLSGFGSDVILLVRSEQKYMNMRFRQMAAISRIDLEAIPLVGMS